MRVRDPFSQSVQLSVHSDQILLCGNLTQILTGCRLLLLTAEGDVDPFILCDDPLVSGLRLLLLLLLLLLPPDATAAAAAATTEATVTGLHAGCTDVFPGEGEVWIGEPAELLRLDEADELIP